jgi:branched-subunit amino acid aminotransferase/4-amino-4-deoxychorismate lyase
MTGVVYFDGSLVRADRARLPALSRAVLYGEGLFETMRAYDGRPFSLDEHLARLELSARSLAIPLPADLANAVRVIPRLLARNGLSDAVVRISVLAGQSAEGLRTVAVKSHLLIAVREVPRMLERERARGVRAVTARAGSFPLSAHKSTSYLRGIAALRGNQDAREVVYVDDSDRILEGTTSNIFALVGNLLYTPPVDGRILPGVTRQIVLEIAGQAGMKVRQKPLSVRIAVEADGLFVTSSVIELLPVVQLNGRSIGKGRPHPLVAVLHGLYQERVRSQG